jgi:hypothetical protein
MSEVLSFLGLEQRTKQYQSRLSSDSLLSALEMRLHWTSAEARPSVVPACQQKSLKTAFFILARQLQVFPRHRLLRPSQSLALKRHFTIK